MFHRFEPGYSRAMHYFITGWTGTDRTRFIESVAGRSGKNPLQVRPQLRHCGLTGHGGLGQACQHKDRPGAYVAAASASLLNFAATDVLCRACSQDQFFHEIDPTQTANPQNPWHQTAAGLRVFLPRRRSGPARPIRARSLPPLRLWPSRPA